MSRPVLLAVDESERSLRDIERELRDRYELHYRIVCLDSAPEAEAELERLADAGEEVALVFAGHSLGGTPGSELLGGARKHHPRAQRGLLIDYASWGEGATGEAIFTAMARRQIDYYLIRPTRTPDELFHQWVSTFLLEWAHAQDPPPTPCRSSASRGRDGHMSCARFSAGAPSPTRSAWPTRRKAARWSTWPAKGSRCRWWCSPTARFSPIRATPN